MVMRHPDHNVLENAADMTFYWAHHEKFIVIDFNTAFIGGIDLCFGRWDTHQHPLADVHPEGVATEIWPGQDFNNNRVMDFQSVDDWKSNELSKAEYGRMPWHDVAMGVVGDCVYDIAEHFVLRWNFVKRDKYKRDGRYDWLTLEGREGADEDLVGVQRPKHPVGDYIHHPLTPLSGKSLGDKQGTVNAQIVRSSADWSSGILTEHSIQNAYSELIRNAQHYVYIENQFFITATGEQQSPIRNTIGRAIVDAVVKASKEGRKFRVICLIPSIPGFAGDLREDAALGTRAIMDYQYKSICRGEHSIFGQIKKEGVDPKEYIFFFNLRSYDRLNVTPAVKQQEEKSGVKYQEVQRAQAQEIMDSGIHGSKDQDEGADTHMGMKGALDPRDDSGDESTEKKTDAKRKFEQAGENKQPESTDSVAKNAMLDTPTLVHEKWEGGLDTEVDNWIQEELYIHGKVMIVDDKHVICGSSNLNDRSQLGIHDSELSIVMTDTKMVNTTMGGQPYEAGYHAATLRRYLWREHLGLLPPQDLDGKDDPNAQPPDVPNDIKEGNTFDFVADPLSDDLWHMWTSRASRNTEVFRQLFHADPDDNGKIIPPFTFPCGPTSTSLSLPFLLYGVNPPLNAQKVKNFDDYDKFLPPKGTKSGHIYDKMIPPNEIRAKLDEIKGHLVWMPLDFLRDVEMAEKGLQVNSWTESVYT
jgi:phospholipase D1/2